MKKFFELSKRLRLGYVQWVKRSLVFWTTAISFLAIAIAVVLGYHDLSYIGAFGMVIGVRLCYLFSYRYKRERLRQFFFSYGGMLIAIYISLFIPEIYVEWLLFVIGMVRVASFPADLDIKSTRLAVLSIALLLVLGYEYVNFDDSLSLFIEHILLNKVLIVIGMLMIIFSAFSAYLIKKKEFEEARHREDFESSIFDQSTNALVLFDRTSGVVQKANSRFAQLFGKIENIDDLKVIEDETDAPINFRSFGDLLSNNLVVMGAGVPSFHIRLEGQSNTIIEAECTVHHDELTEKIQLSIHDQSKEIFERNNLINARDEAINLIESLPVGAIVINADSSISYLSRQGSKMLGYTQEEVIGQNCGILLYDPEDQRVKSMFSALMEGGQQEYRTVLRLRRKDGSDFYVTAHVGAFGWVNGDQDQFLISAWDISDQIAKEHQLVETQSVLSSVIEQSGYASYVVDGDGRLLYSNLQGLDYCTSDEHKIAVGENLHGCLSNPLGTWLMSWLPKVLDTRSEYQSEINFYRDDQKPQFLELKIKSLPYADSQEIFGALFTINDITKSKESEIETQIAKDRYQSVFTNTVEGIFVIDNLKLKIVDCNHIGEEIFGLDSTRSLDALQFSDFLAERPVKSKNKDQFLKMVFRRLFRHGRYEEDVRLKHQDGAEFLGSLKIISDRNSLVPRTICFVRDISAKAALKKENRRRRILLANFLENTGYAIDIIKITGVDENGPTGEILYRNNTSARILGVDEPHLSQGSLTYIEGERDYDTVHLSELLEDGSTSYLARLDVEGRSVDYFIREQLLPIEEDLFLMRMLEDVSASIKREQKLRESLDLLEQNRVKLEEYIESNLQLENFAYIASHDLRAPLRAVISFAKLFDQNYSEGLDPKAKRYLDIIIKNSQNMLVFITDLLTFSKVNASKIDHAEIDVEILVNQVLSDLSSQIDQQSAQIKIEGLPQTIHGERSLLKMVFQNLISNALKFAKVNEPPVIVVTSEEMGSHYRFTVTDNGIGLDMQYADKIFQIFEKLHSHDKYDGSGLGLAISKRIIEKHGGTLGVDSELNQGASFFFTVPRGHRS